jgi:phospholipid/cholesterol/gamma-HCH transport system ATP-binding protein
MDRTSPDPIIKVDGLVARFGSNTVLEKVSFEVKTGEIVVIAGGSGCGKSTLLKHLIGIYEPAEGRIEINGVELGRASSDEMSRLRRSFGVSFQSGALLGSLSVLENVMLPMLDERRLKKSTAALLAKTKLSMVGLSGYENHLPSEISGGMVKRAAFARALALDPVVLFFDEPSAGLDPITSAGLDRTIIRINQGLRTTMVIVTHELQSIFAIAHRVVLLDKSEKGIIAQGPPAKLRDESRDPRVIRFFSRQAEED